MAVLNTKNITSNLKEEIKVTTIELRNRLIDTSPVLTGRYRRSWRFSTKGLSSKIFNPISYGVYIEGGYPSPPYSSGGGLTGFNSKLWSKKSIGGTVDPGLGIMPTNAAWGDGFAIRIANAVMKGL